MSLECEYGKERDLTSEGNDKENSLANIHKFCVKGL